MPGVALPRLWSDPMTWVGSSKLGVRGKYAMHQQNQVELKREDPVKQNHLLRGKLHCFNSLLHI